MSITYGNRNFLDDDNFMRLPDGRIAFFTEKKNWCEVLKHGLPLDDYLYYQTHFPKISFEYKTSTRRQRKHKEGLNDEERCDMCRNPLDTMTFVTRQGQKKVYCSECIHEYDNNNILDDIIVTRQGQKKVYCSECIHEYDNNNILDDIIVMQNHLEDINAILYLLDGEVVMSIAYFYIKIKFLVDTWKSYIGNEVIRRIFEMIKSWSAEYEYGYVNILKLLEELRLLKKRLKDEINFLDNILPEDEPW